LYSIIQVSIALSRLASAIVRPAKRKVLKTTEKNSRQTADGLLFVDLWFWAG